MRCMRAITVCAGLFTLALQAQPASAEAAGNWRVSGAISGKDFIVDCRFTRTGKSLDGVCVDAATGDGKVKANTHTLTQGEVNGSAVHWSYPTKVMFMSIDIHFDGIQSGDRMSGKVSVKGREGTFSAVRR